ncbi:hypothetical protein [Ensifer adhaerens]|uniref:hypothetical protein n=1 Tax=Ensifer adhaerens TaxID=106592 RepID=UPI00132F391D|nr:hypothetical protein [Ensifer adhaerens]QHG70104.1 hypothetical protein DQW09_09660 [Ensifer adhaerens]
MIRKDAEKDRNKPSREEDNPISSCAACSHRLECVSVVVRFPRELEGGHMIGAVVRPTVCFRHRPHNALQRLLGPDHGLVREDIMFITVQFWRVVLNVDAVPNQSQVIKFFVESLISIQKVMLLRARKQMVHFVKLLRADVLRDRIHQARDPLPRECSRLEMKVVKQGFNNRYRRYADRFAERSAMTAVCRLLACDIERGEKREISIDVISKLKIADETAVYFDQISEPSIVKH